MGEFHVAIKFSFTYFAFIFDFTGLPTIRMNLNQILQSYTTNIINNFQYQISFDYLGFYNFIAITAKAIDISRADPL